MMSGDPPCGLGTNALESCDADVVTEIDAGCGNGESHRCSATSEREAREVRTPCCARGDSGTDERRGGGDSSSVVRPSTQGRNAETSRLEPRVVFGGHLRERVASLSVLPPGRAGEPVQSPEEGYQDRKKGIRDIARDLWAVCCRERPDAGHELRLRSRWLPEAVHAVAPFTKEGQRDVTH